MITRIRHAIGAIAFGWAAYVAIVDRRRPRVAVDRDTGEVLGFRISPLSRDEREAAAAIERRLHGFDIASGAGVDSATPAAAVVPNHGGPPVEAPVRRALMHTAPDPAPPDWPLRAPVENPTAAHLTSFEAGRWSAPGIPLERSGAVTPDSGLPLSEATARAEDELRPLIRAREAINRIAREALAAGRRLADPDLEDAGVQLTAIEIRLDAVIASLEETIYGPIAAPRGRTSLGPTPDRPEVVERLEYYAGRSIAPETELERRARDGDR